MIEANQLRTLTLRNGYLTNQKGVNVYLRCWSRFMTVKQDRHERWLCQFELEDGQTIETRIGAERLERISDAGAIEPPDKPCLTEGCEVTFSFWDRRKYCPKCSEERMRAQAAARRDQEGKDEGVVDPAFAKVLRGSWGRPVPRPHAGFVS